MLQFIPVFFSETNTNIDQYSVIPVGSVGAGNVRTTYEWKPDGSGGQVLVFQNSITNFENMRTLNIASSFATALLKCLNSETNKLNTDATIIANELNELKRKFGPVKNFLDILFNNSKKREYIFDLKHIILESRREITKLTTHKIQLEAIAQDKQ